MQTNSTQSAEPIVPPPTDGGGKAEPGVPQARLIARLNEEVSAFENSEREPRLANYYAAFGLRRAIKIIQDEFADELVR